MRRARLLVPGLLVGAAAAGGGGCGGDCCKVDSLPIPVTRAPLGSPAGAGDGAMLALAASPTIAGGQPFPMVVDTGSSITVLSTGVTGGGLQIQRRAFDLLDALAAAPPPLRAQFRDINLLDLPLGAVGAAGTQPLGVLGGDLLRIFSVELRFAAPCPAGAASPTGGTCSSVTFWHHMGAGEGFLEDAGFAVLRFALRGGGEVTASGEPDIFGVSGPLEIPPTRIVLRACGAPRAFVPTEPRELCCVRGQELALGTGVDLSLLVSTGVGPLVLSGTAWKQLTAQLPAPPFMTPGSLLVATWNAPIAAQWTSIPRLALVDLEAGANSDPGPCVELARSRRIEWASYQAVNGPVVDACVQPCDTDPRDNSLAQNSAAYIELGGSIPVAVVADEEPFLQGLREDIRPEGPEIDGVIGAGALGLARVEIDYLNNPPRALFSCEAAATRDACWTAARCPRLSDGSQVHYCFGLGPHSLPARCAPSGC
jgi:hypothetical protein